MNEIKCPKCGTTFKIDESVYDSIVKQIRDDNFYNELKQREKQFKIDKENAVLIAINDKEKELNNELNKKDIEINNLKNNLKNKELEIINKLEKDYKDKLNKKEIEISNLENKLKQIKTENELSLKNTINETKKALKKTEDDIINLKKRLSNLN